MIGVPKKHFNLEYYGAPGIKVTPVVNGADADVQLETFVTNSAECSVEYRILDGEKIVAKCDAAADHAAVDMKIENVHLWDGVKDPDLYTAKASLIFDGEKIDEVSVRFGCRSFEIDAQRGFILNGREYSLRGVSRHQDRPKIGNALTYEHHREDIDLICEMGANTIRLAHYQHAQEFYRFAGRTFEVACVQAAEGVRHHNLLRSSKRVHTCCGYIVRRFVDVVDVNRKMR